MRILLNEVDKDLSQNTEVLLLFRNSEKKKMLYWVTQRAWKHFMSVSL